MYHDWWSQHETIYEQPMVKFQHKFIFMAEHGDLDNALLMDRRLVACNSFKYLNELLTDFPDCASIKVRAENVHITMYQSVISTYLSNTIHYRYHEHLNLQFWQMDLNFDQIVDRMNFQFVFRPPQRHSLKHFDLYLEFDSRMTVSSLSGNMTHGIWRNIHFLSWTQSKCNLPIPSALLLQQEPIPANFLSGEITIEGYLRLRQSATFHCPFFLRNIKSHFFHNLVPENSTDIRDFDFKTIRRQIVNNPGYLLFEKSNVFWNRHQENKIIINVIVHIRESKSIYHSTFWQKLGRLWLQYLSIFIVFWYCADKLKNYMFTNQKIKAWELVPWKKMYWTFRSRSEYFEMSLFFSSKINDLKYIINSILYSLWEIRFSASYSDWRPGCQPDGCLLIWLLCEDSDLVAPTDIGIRQCPEMQ